MKGKLYIHVNLHCDIFLFTNQPDALIIQTLFYYKNLHVSGNHFAHHQELPTVHSALVSFMQVIKNLHETCQCRMCSRELLMMGKEGAQIM